MTFFEDIVANPLLNFMMIPMAIASLILAILGLLPRKKIYLGDCDYYKITPEVKEILAAKRKKMLTVTYIIFWNSFSQEIKEEDLVATAPFRINVDGKILETKVYRGDIISNQLKLRT